MNIKIEGTIKVSANDGDILEYPFEADNFKDAIAALSITERVIEKTVVEAENRFKDEE